MERRTLASRLLLGALVVLLVAVAVPIVYLAGRDGIDAVRAGNADTAGKRGLVALLAAFVPVLAVAAYAHWLNRNSQRRAPHERRIPGPVERVFLAVAVILVVIAGWPIVALSYRQSVDAFDATDLAFGVAYGLLAIAYVSFAVFCVKRYFDWSRGTP